MVYINKNSIEKYYTECTDTTVDYGYLSKDNIIFDTLILNGLSISLKYNYFSVDKHDTNIIVSFLSDDRTENHIIPVPIGKDIFIFMSDTGLNIFNILKR